jgi:hypothetical protein
MSEMNRRDYLKRLAASTAGIAGSGLEVFGQRTRRKTRPQKTKRRQRVQTVTIDAIAENFQQWPGTQARPASAPILVTFHGLVDFYYNASGSNAGTCGVGFHRGGGHHTPKVEVYETGNSSPIESIPIANNSEVRLGIVNAANQDQPAKVEFLKNGGPDDFRLLIDMQSRSWYPGTQTRGVYAAKLFIRHGTFYTLEPTVHKLNQVVKLELPGLPSYIVKGDLGRPANVIGDAMNLAGTERALLKVNGREIPLPRDAQKTYEVRFSNMCTNTVPQGPCDFFWWHYQEEKRNDFHHHRDTLVLPPFSAKYSVVLAPGELPPKKRDPQRGRDMANTNDAPCMGAGYGGGPGP